MNTAATTLRAGASERTAPTPSVKKIAGITIGNALEFFDFTVYSVFATVFGRLFFPSTSEIAQLLASLAVFGVGFIARPLGAVVIGGIADRVGRKPAMSLSLWLMGLGSAIFVLTPTYAQIGVAAPILIIVGRLIQGFAVGGEVGASTSMLLEYATDKTRGYYGSWQLFSQALSSLCGTALGLALTRNLSPEALDSWGWRIPFAIGLLVIPVGYFIRRHLEETGEVHVAESGPRPPSTLGVLLRHHLRQIFTGLGIVVGGTTAAYMVLYYITNYAKTVLHMPLATGLWATWVAAAVQLVTAAFMGKLSDRIGRRPVMLLGHGALFALVLPAFMLMDSQRTGASLILAVLMLILPLVAVSVAGVVMMTELFPRSVRATGLSLVYGLGVAVFGGFAQFNATWLVKATGSSLAPAWYMMACVGVAMVAVWSTRETAGHKLN